LRSKVEASIRASARFLSAPVVLFSSPRLLRYSELVMYEMVSWSLSDERVLIREIRLWRSSMPILPPVTLRSCFLSLSLSVPRRCINACWLLCSFVSVISRRAFISSPRSTCSSRLVASTLFNVAARLRATPPRSSGPVESRSFRASGSTFLSAFWVSLTMPSATSLRAESILLCFCSGVSASALGSVSAFGFGFASAIHSRAFSCCASSSLPMAMLKSLPWSSVREPIDSSAFLRASAERPLYQEDPW